MLSSPLQATTATPTGAIDSGKEEERQQILARDLQTIAAYINQNHGDLLKKFVQAFTPLGEEISKKNFWRGKKTLCSQIKTLLLLISFYDTGHIP